MIPDLVEPTARWLLASFVATLTFWGWWQVLDAVRDRLKAAAVARRESVSR